MSSQGKSLGKHTIVYAVGIVIGKLASFIMLPVYTRLLSPADYGVLELLTMTIEVIGMIAGMGLLAGIFKFCAEAQTTAEQNLMLSTAGLGTIGLAISTALVGIAASPLLTDLLFGEEGNPLYLRLFFLVYLFQNFEHVPLARIRVQQQSVLFVAVNAAKLLSMLALNILFLVHFRMGVLGVMLSGCIVAGIFAIGFTVYLFRNVGASFSGAKFREMVSFGSPMILWALGTFVLVFSDRFFLNHFGNTAAVGIYSLAYKFAFVLSALAHHPFQMMWDPHRFEIAKRPDAKSIYPRVFLYLNVVLGIGAAVIALFIKDFLGIMSDPAFLPAHAVVPIVLAAQIIYLWVEFYNLGLYLTNKTQIMAAIAVCVVPLTIALNMILIPRFGLFGAAWATLVVYSARSLAVYYFAQRAYPIEFGWIKVGKLYTILASAVAVRFLVDPDSILASLGSSTLLLVLAVGAVYLHVLGPWERAQINAAVRRALSVPRLGAMRA